MSRCPPNCENKHPRIVDTLLTFQLGVAFDCHSGDVVIDSKRYKVWSPNSTWTPFYPGVFPKSFIPRFPLQHPMYDGSAGWDDWTTHPQTFLLKYLQHPFITLPNVSLR
jgi:hypothetical protein